jgi:hypothetical protein
VQDTGSEPWRGRVICLYQASSVLKGSTRNNSGFGLIISKYCLSAFLIVEGVRKETTEHSNVKEINVQEEVHAFCSVIFFG